jgi:hypothetical protein
MREKHEDLFGDEDLLIEREPLKGTNFLVSAVMILKRQKKDLFEENKILRARLEILESQNAAFMNLSADRLLQS